MRKTGIYVVLTVALLSFFTVGCPVSSAQPGRKGGWQDKMKAERVAYLTETMELTSSEAEKFWPVYNEMETERRILFKKVMESYKKLDEAVNAGKPESEVSVLLEKYFRNMDASHGVEAKYLPRMKEILSVDKIAKLFLGEEEFRRQQINRWKGNGAK